MRVLLYTNESSFPVSLRGSFPKQSPHFYKGELVAAMLRQECLPRKNTDKHGKAGMMKLDFNEERRKQERSNKMYNRLTLKDVVFMSHTREKTDNIISAMRDFKDRHKPCFMKCAVIYMAAKIGIILLASFTAMIYLMSHVTQYLAIEMSQTKALLFAVPLTLVIAFKLYFIFRMLLTYDRSRLMIQTVVNAIVLKGMRGVRQVGESLPGDLPSLSWEKARKQ